MRRYLSCLVALTACQGLGRQPASSRGDDTPSDAGSNAPTSDAVAEATASASAAPSDAEAAVSDTSSGISGFLVDDDCKLALPLRDTGLVMDVECGKDGERIPLETANGRFSVPAVGACTLTAIRHWTGAVPDTGTIGSGHSWLGTSRARVTAPARSVWVHVNDRTGHRDGGSSAGPCREGVLPSIQVGRMTVTGRLPPEVIERIVKQSFRRFRGCYEQGLSQNATLQGQVSATFVIARSGEVAKASATDPGTTLPDPAVVACIVRGLTGLSFPQPEADVTVVFPMILTPFQGEAAQGPP